MCVSICFEFGEIPKYSETGPFSGSPVQYLQAQKLHFLYNPTEHETAFQSDWTNTSDHIACMAINSNY